MKIVELIQGSPNWLEWRRSHITGTSAAVLMDHNPWKTPIDLFEEMLEISIPQPMNSRMQRGHDLEPIARDLFIEQSGITFEPIVAESDEFPWMGASLDGWNEDNKAILEIKCPSDRSHNDALLGIVAEYYVDQCQHALGVTGGDICYYVSYHPEHSNKLAVVEIKPDVDYIKQIIEVERKFYEENLCQFKVPGWTLKSKRK